MFADADWAKDNDRVSVSGYISYFQGCPISWGSKKQKGTVALSSMEAETVSACLGATEAAWLRKLWGIFDPTALNVPVNLCVDNQAVIYFANADVAHTKAKHIDLKYYYVKSCIADGTIMMWHVPTQLTFSPSPLEQTVIST